MTSRVPKIENLPLKKTDIPFLEGIDITKLFPNLPEINLIDLPQREDYNQISFETFTEVVSKKPFLENLLTSILALTEYKLSYYKTVINNQIELSKNSKAIVEDLKASGVSQDEIERQTPGYSGSATVTTVAQTIQHDLLARKKTLTIRTLSESVTKAFTDPKDGLISLRGQKSIKAYLATTLFAFSKNWKVLSDPFKNIALYGPPGSGKGKVARVISHVFYCFGVIENKVPKIVTSTDLIGSHVGKTAPRVRGNFFEGLGRVMFIDEAYQMAHNEYGKEGLTELVSLLDLYAPVSLVIVAGYHKDMVKNFMPTNKGLHRRFPYQFSLEPYDALDLAILAKESLVNLLPEGAVVDDQDISLIYSLFDRILEENPEIFEYQASDIKELSRESAMKIGNDWGVLTPGQKLSIFEDSIDLVISKKGLRDEA